MTISQQIHDLKKQGRTYHNYVPASASNVMINTFFESDGQGGSVFCTALIWDDGYTLSSVSPLNNYEMMASSGKSKSGAVDYISRGAFVVSLALFSFITGAVVFKALLQ